MSLYENTPKKADIELTKHCCFSGHVAEFTVYTEGIYKGYHFVNCDLCGCLFLPSFFRWRCVENCFFDVCRHCWKPPKQCCIVINSDTEKKE